MRVQMLKRKARKLNKEYCKLLEPYSCGAHLAEHINPQIAIVRKKYEAVIEELKEIDPDFPTLIFLRTKNSSSHLN